MVARTRLHRTSVTSRWFRTWRGFLAGLAAAVSDIASAATERARMAASHLRRWTARGVLKPGSLLSAALASVLVLGGQTVFVLLSPPGRLRAQAVTTSALLLVSLAITLTVLVAQSAAIRKSERKVLWAWLIGMTPWAVAVAPLLWPFAWVASAAITARLLRRAGFDSAWIFRAVALAWSTQVLAGGGAWLAGNASTLMMMR